MGEGKRLLDVQGGGGGSKVQMLKISLSNQFLGPRPHSFGIYICLHVKLHKTLYKKALIFKFWVIFDKVMIVYSEKILKTLQNFSFWCHWDIPEKYQRGVEDIEFSGVLRKYQVDFPGVNYKQHGISRGDQEKIMWNFQGSWF